MTFDVFKAAAWLPLAGTVAGLLIGLGLIVMNARCGITPDPVPEAAPLPAPAPPGPACIHEVCGERLGGLRCARSDSYYYCEEYRSFYERHCVCDRWEETKP